MRLDFIIVFPELFITLWLVALLIQFTILTKQKHKFSERSLIKRFIANPIPCITAILLVLSIYYFIIQTAGFSNYMVLSGLYSTTVIYYIRLLLSFLFVLYFIHLRTNINSLVFYSYEFYIVIFFAFLALNFVLVSVNFLNLFIFIEIYSMCIYYLVGSKKNSAKGVEASIKYFIFGSFSSAFLLFGIFLVYFSTGTIDLVDLSNLTFQNLFFRQYVLYVIGAYLICFSLMIKMGASIFFFWIVEVYDGISFNMLIFLNIFPKIVYLITLLNLVTKFNLFHLTMVVKILILSSLLIGLLGALNETRTKKFLVFTSIYNITFFSIPFWGLSNEIIGVLIFFSSIYLLNFFVFMVLFSNLKDMRTETISKNLIDLYELKVQNPQFASLFVIFALFSSGLPMTALFLAKFSFFFEFSRLSYIFMLLYFLILGTLSYFYYIRIIKIVLQGVSLPNILFQPISLTSALMYSFILWFNLIAIFFYNDIILFLNFFLTNVK